MLVVLGHVGRGRVVVRLGWVEAACTLVLSMWGVVVMCKDIPVTSGQNIGHRITHFCPLRKSLLTPEIHS